MLAKLMRLLICTIGATIVLASISTAEPVMVEVSDVHSAVDDRSSRPILKMTIKTPAALRLGEVTRKRGGKAMTVTSSSELVGKKMTLLLNGTAIVTTVIREPLTGGSLQISDESWTDEKAKSLADQLSVPGARVELDIASE